MIINRISDIHGWSWIFIYGEIHNWISILLMNIDFKVIFNYNLVIPLHNMEKNERLSYFKTNFLKIIYPLFIFI